MTQNNDPFDGLFNDKPWAKLPETEPDEVEQSGQDYDLPEDVEEVEESEESVEDEEIQEPDEEDEDLVPAEQTQQSYNLPGIPGGYGDYSPSDLMEEFDEDQTPAGFKQLFDPRGNADLTKLTETPAKMVLPLVRAEVIDAAYDPERVKSGKSLLRVFTEAFDRRMISKDRKGRFEAVELIRGLSRGDADGEEEASL